MISAGTIMRSYSGTEAQWLKAADYFDSCNERRLAKAIRHGLERQNKRLSPHFRYIELGPSWVYGLRFRDGSIAKLDAYIERQQKP